MGIEAYDLTSIHMNICKWRIELFSFNQKPPHNSNLKQIVYHIDVREAEGTERKMPKIRFWFYYHKNQMNHALNELNSQWIASIILDIWLFKNVNTHNYSLESVWSSAFVLAHCDIEKNRLFVSISQNCSILFYLIYYIFLLYWILSRIRISMLTTYYYFIPLHNELFLFLFFSNKSNICLLFRVYRLLSSSIVIWTASEWYNQHSTLDTNTPSFYQK